MNDGDSDLKGQPVAVNDNGSVDSPAPEALRKVNGVALQLARIIGRRMAREDFEKAMSAANDNAPTQPDDHASS